jgi:hypothetical protein
VAPAREQVEEAKVKFIQVELASRAEVEAVLIEIVVVAAVEVALSAQLSAPIRLPSEEESNGEEVRVWEEG